MEQLFAVTQHELNELQDLPVLSAVETEDAALMEPAVRKENSEAEAEL